MNMMNKCAKFHKDSPSGKKVKFNLTRAIELSETTVFVYNFVKKPYVSEQLRWHIWPIFPLNFFMKFSQKMPLNCFYTTVQKRKLWEWTQRNGQFYVQLCTEHQCNQATLMAFYTNFATEFFHMVFTRRSVLKGTLIKNRANSDFRQKSNFYSTFTYYGSRKLKSC